MSDHSAVHLSIKPPSSQHRSSAYWHFNNSLLIDQNYREIIHLFWSNWQIEKRNFNDVCKWWDLGKAQIKTLTQKYSSRLAREKRAVFLCINSQIEELQSAPDITPEAQQVLKEQLKELNIL